jgi:hypothetical protein
MDVDEETGEKKGGKGAETEAGRENVNVVVPTGDSDDLDGNRAQREVLAICEGNDGDRERENGQVLMATGQSTKNSSWGNMDIEGTTGATTVYDGKPTESDVVDKLDGSIGWHDRSLGGEFSLPGRKKGGSTSVLKKVTMVSTVEATARSKQWTTKEEDSKMTPEEFIMGEKSCMERARKKFGINQPKTLAPSLASGGQGASGVAKLTILRSTKEAKKTATAVAAETKKTKLEIIREEVAARNHRTGRRIGGSIGHLIGSAVGTMKSRPEVKTAAAIMTAAGALVTKDVRKTVAETTPGTSNMVDNNQRIQSPGSKDKEIEGETIGLACIFEQGTITDTGSGIEENNNGMEPEEAAMGSACGTSSTGIESGRLSWSEIEKRMRLEDGYEVRYEYSEKQSEIPRSVPTELYTLAVELWRADPDLELFSLNKELYPIVGIDEFPSTSAEYEEFFARAGTQINEQLNHTFGFYIRTKPSTQCAEPVQWEGIAELSNRKKDMVTTASIRHTVSGSDWLVCVQNGGC